MQFTDVTTVAFAIRWHVLGDLLCTMPLVLQWKRTFPHTAVTLVVSEKNALLLPFLEGYDQFLVVPHSLKGIRETRNNYRKVYFDLAVSCVPKYSIEMDALLWGLNAKQRVGVEKSKWLNPCGVFVNRPVCKSRLQTREVHHSLSVLRILFPEFEEVPESLYPVLTAPRKSTVGNKDMPEILISTSNRREYCSLGVRGHVEILNTLFALVKFRVVISCMDEGQDVIHAEAVANQLQAPTSIIRTPELGDLLSLLDRVDLVFAGDGGLVHMAAALNKFQVALYTRKIVQWRPLSRRAMTLDHPEHVIKISREKILAALMLQLERACDAD